MNAKVNRFERILKTKVKVRDDERILLSMEKKEEERLLSVLATLGTEKEQALASFGSQKDETFTVQDIWFRRKAIDHLDSRICREGESLCGVRQSIENTEARLLEKHRDVKVMQKYISFLVEDLQDESKKQEQSELDDIAGIRHGSPKVSGVSRVMGRIEEIERKIRPQKDKKAREEKKDRFVDVLETAERKEQTRPEAEEKSRRPVVPGVVSAEKTASGGWEDHIAPLAAEYGVDEALVRAVIRMESGGRTAAVSPKGAMGLMQLMPGTARMLGVEDPFDPVQNLEGGIKYLSQLSDKYQGDLVKTLAAYNAGPGRVDSYGGVPPFAETRNYVKNVLSTYRKNSGSDD